MRFGLVVVAVLLSGCDTITRATIDQISNLTLTSLHQSNISISYTIKIQPIEQIPP